MQASHITADQIDALLPQTQCGKCGHPGCLPYAKAIVDGEAINRCPPGGQRTADALATLLDKAPLPLAQPAESPLLAVIDEDICIGCTKCIKACPVDAILGAPKQMHSILRDECTGCELCVMPCPVDCISMVPHPGWLAAHAEQEQHAWLAHRATQGRQRHQAHIARIAQWEAEALERRRTRRHQRIATPTSPAASTPTDDAALRRRLKIKLARMKRDDSLRPQLEAQLQALGGQTAARPVTPVVQQARSQRIALAAAEDTLRRAERHLAHCQRQEGPMEVAAAQEQLERAQHQLERARQALDPT
ncbi:predicted NADH:ubiquinone oxidoreductase [Zymobacter palmae]|uniref:Predicted NADH:ubiquinone oxidoreductase n=1 Tax=Zymobacter palmae TaxID=33074 RepID=A0A348HDP2_9GAMM|nr:RnfABCDGE type electron transport complex subunit B [Zymobacter palmae]BBG29744.1 predicted NADH:ubiquinone oxidoreductase [Zymobacter palmae]